MLFEITLGIIQFIAVIIALISVILIYKTIKSNERLNQRILFSNITKEERELRIKLQEYREKMDNVALNKKEREVATLHYETLLFNYYEFLAICLFKELIREDEAKLYFKEILKSVKNYFESSLLFENKVAGKEEYPGIQWLFKKWKV